MGHGTRISPLEITYGLYLHILRQSSVRLESERVVVAFAVGFESVRGGIPHPVRRDVANAVRWHLRYLVGSGHRVATLYSYVGYTTAIGVVRVCSQMQVAAAVEAASRFG